MDCNVTLVCISDGATSPLCLRIDNSRADSGSPSGVTCGRAGVRRQGRRQPDRDDVSTQWASTVREFSTVGEIEIEPMTGIEPAMGS